MKVLFVCLGNICRSPLAKVILEHQFFIKNIQASVDSCATSHQHVNHPADPRSIKIAKHYNLSLQNHIAKQFSFEFFATFDWIFPMDLSNQKNLLLLNPPLHFVQKIRLFREFDPLSSPNNLDVPDPYHGDLDGFDLCYQMLLRSSIAFCDSL